MEHKPEYIGARNVRTVDNADYILIMQKLAQEKAVNVVDSFDRVVGSPRSERVVNKAAKALVAVAAIVFGVPILIQVVKWLLL